MASSRKESDEDEETCSYELRSFCFGPELSQNISLWCVEVFRGVLLSNDGQDRTGHMVWPGAHLMCKFLCHFRQRFAGKSLVELGAGSGLCGLVATSMCAAVVLTDGQPHVVRLLEKNIKHVTAHSSVFSGACTSQVLRWGDEAAARELVWSHGGGFDMVLGSDIIYPHLDRDGIAALMRTAHTLLSHHQHAVFVCSYVPRRKDTSRLLVEASYEHGFVATLSPHHLFSTEPSPLAMIIEFRRPLHCSPPSALVPAVLNTASHRHSDAKCALCSQDGNADMEGAARRAGCCVYAQHKAQFPQAWWHEEQYPTEVWTAPFLGDDL